MATKKDGREIVTIGVGSAAVLRGEDDINTWDDEELAMGRRRDANGYFTGKPPRLIPAACYTELKRRQVFDAESTLGKAVAEASAYLANVARGIEEPNMGRIRACESLLDRVVGKPKERIEAQLSVQAQVETLPWVQALRQSVRLPGEHRAIDPSTSDGDIIDAEVIEDSWGVPPGVRAMPTEDDPILEDDDPGLTGDDELAADFVEEAV